MIEVPYISQWDDEASASNNDCGPVSCTMVLRYYLEKMTADEFFRQTGAGQGYVNFPQMQKAISYYGYKSDVLSYQTVEKLKQFIDSGLPVIALVQYSKLSSVQDKNFKGPHLLVVTGYRENDYFVNDPNFQGEYREHGKHAYTKKEFEEAWNATTTDGNVPRCLLVIYPKNQVSKPEQEGTIAVPISVNEGNVKKASQWDKLVSWLELGNPLDTLFENVQRVVAGLKSRATDLQNQLTSETTERKNRDEQVGRLKEQLTEEQKLRAELSKKLGEAASGVPATQKVYEDRIKVLQGQIDQLAKEKGALSTENGQLKVRADELSKGLVEKATITELVYALINKVIAQKLSA